jgi:hypothetical protein
MGTRATKGTGENKGFGQRKTLFSKKKNIRQIFTHLPRIHK